ncbi:MAG TPA: redoxin domain-containing protein [Terriglobales bacterium]|nr:redoxin domain-containing protein [Terriglobales bacterium]
MRHAIRIVFLAGLVASSLAQDQAEHPINEQAQKTYKDAESNLRQHMVGAALDGFKKADKQDGGHCTPCQQKMVKYGVELGDWKTAETGAEELLAQANGDKDVALAHYQLGIVYYNEGIQKRKSELLERAHDEFSKALVSAPNFPDAIFADGQALARLNQDHAAKARFEQFVEARPADDPRRQRAQRYIEEPELARARMVPAFTVTTTDGQRISMDELKGKVVLIDFWATWCAPCREALPHMRQIVKKFEGQPLVVLSVSLDDDEQKWRNFIVKNEMTWPQYRDGGFTGPIARLFDVRAIPNTFTIDADGVLQDQRIGDPSVEGKLKKLINRAREIQAAGKPTS